MTKIILFFLIFARLSIFSQMSFAETLIEFDTPNIIAEESNGKIHGYYGMTLDEVEGIRHSVSCAFFITSENIPTREKSSVKIQTFYTNTTYKNRDKNFELSGELEIKNAIWKIQMEEVQPGCLSAAGGGFQKGSAISNIEDKRTSIIGIRTIKNKTNFYDFKEGNFSPRKGFLILGDVVIAYRQNANFYYVKFFNITTSNNSFGWIKKIDTNDPFPE